ncbi:MAG: hypothetical protein ACFFAH_00370 [Promethearchaeota archaeon]
MAPGKKEQLIMTNIALKNITGSTSFHKIITLLFILDGKIKLIIKRQSKTNFNKFSENILNLKREIISLFGSDKKNKKKLNITTPIPINRIIEFVLLDGFI